jgi:hypothetical protein
VSAQPDTAQAVPAYLATVARRYLPVVAFFAGIALIILLVPSVTSNQLAANSNGTSPGTIESASGSGAAGVGNTNGNTGPNAVANGAGSVTASGTVAATPATGPAGSVGGTTVSGLACKPGVRQVPWSKYAPWCVPAWQGNNAGATAPGVTATTITLGYRISSSAQQAALNSAVPGAIPPDPGYISDLNTYLSLFNRSFELYGRKVVLKTFQGQGDWVLEQEGQDLQGAQADAATEHQLGAFGDITEPIEVSVAYARELAQQRVISFDNIGASQTVYEQLAPYTYNTVPTGEQEGTWGAHLACARLSGLPAIFAGDPSYQKRPRAFGLISADTPYNIQEGDTLQQQMGSECNVHLAKRANYTVDPSNAQEAPSMIAQMHSAGVTTLYCFECDNIYLDNLMNQADSQGYSPEWVLVNHGVVLTRLASQKQMAHAIASDDVYFTSGVPRQQAEAYKAFKLAVPNSDPAENGYSEPYYNLLRIFAALQQAGPNLTPATLEQAIFALPPSAPGGDDGLWASGPASFTPRTNSPVTRWDPDATSYYDGKRGAFVFCDGAAPYGFFDQTSWGAHRPLQC